MKRILACFLLLFTFAGCGQLDSFWPVIDADFGINIDPVGPYNRNQVVVDERPVVNVPMALRQSNWLGRRGQGSCTWATAISLLRWQGRYRTADWIRKNYGDGEMPDSYTRQLDDAGIRYAQVINGDVNFLEWACKTRRGCGITVRGGRHMVSLVHLDKEWAGILDNNSVEKIIWVPRASLIAEWKASYGWAVVPVYTPSAPMPARPA